MNNQAKCTYCEEIWYDRNEKSFIYEIETCHWDDWEDGYAKENIHIKYCFHCGTSYEMDSLISLMERYLQFKEEDERVEELLSVCSLERLEALKIALSEQMDIIRYSESVQQEAKRVRGESFKALLDKIILNIG